MGQDSRGSHGAAGASKKVPVISHIQRPANTIRRYLLKELVTEFRWAINSLSRRRLRLPLNFQKPEEPQPCISSAPGDHPPRQGEGRCPESLGSLVSNSRGVQGRDYRGHTPDD